MMRSILTQLESNEALLLMYLAGELSPQDRVQVERMLEQDAGLRAGLESLRRAVQSVDGRLSDAVRVDDISAERAIRQTIAAMRSRDAAVPRHDVVAPEGEVRRIPGWAYPVAAAAILLIAVSAYLVNMNHQQRTVATAREVDVPDLVAMLTAETPPSETVATEEAADDLAATFDDSDLLLADAADGDGLVVATAELGAIERLSGEPAGSGGLR